MCISNAVKKQSSIGIIVDALFANFAYLHNLYSVVELHKNFVLIHFESQHNKFPPFFVIILHITPLRIISDQIKKFKQKFHTVFVDFKKAFESSNHQ